MKNNYLILYLFCFISFPLWGKGEHPALLPSPQQLTWIAGDFHLKEISLSIEEKHKEIIREWLTETATTINPNSPRQILFTTVDNLPGVAVNPEEAYRLKVTSGQITVEALTEKGFYWAVQTLRQLSTKQGEQFKVSGCEILDWPAFRIRGFMHDVGRGFISVEELKREIAMLSRYKINTFHWHLTDNQAWRLESKRFPQLNDPVNMTRLSGLYYTQEEARELIAHCRKHNVLLIPEIEMPGHSEAFVRTFGVDMQSDGGMAILKQLLDEACEVFAELPYLHIGTDEVRFTNPGFVPEMVAYVRSKGMKVVSWNPGWEYKKGEIDMLQMWSYRGKPHEGIPVIDSRLHYLNHYDAFADPAALYFSNVAGQKQGSPDYAGAILAVWNDRRVEQERNILLENGFYPAMLTLAERAWRGGQEEYFYTRGSLIGPEESDDYKAFADFEERMLWHKENHFREYPFAYVRQTNVKWRISDPFPNGGELKKAFPPEESLADSYLYNGTRYNSSEATGAGIYLRHVWGNTVPSFYKDPQPNHTAYAWTWVWSPKEQEVGLWACTQNYGRSEKDLPPPQGKWDYKESRIWLNDKEIQPPIWTATHTELSNEIPLGNENFEARPPIPAKLNKGWNKVLLKLPVGAFSTPEVRLVKWMFTFVFVSPDGTKEVDGLVYSPDRVLPLVARQQSYSAYYQQRVSLFESLPVSPEDIVFLGNSITDGGEWGELFAGKRVKNRGISGDIAMGVYDRLETIIKGKPAKIFLLIGINDLSKGTPPETIVKQIGQTIRRLQQESPQTALYLQSVLPVNDGFGMFEGHTSRWAEVKEINQGLQSIAKEAGLTYVDLYSHFIGDEPDKMNRMYTNDGLHLLGEGYLKWMEIITPYIEG